MAAMRPIAPASSAIVELIRQKHTCAGHASGQRPFPITSAGKDLTLGRSGQRVACALAAGHDYRRAETAADRPPAQAVSRIALQQNVVRSQYCGPRQSRLRSNLCRTATGLGCAAAAPAAAPSPSAATPQSRRRKGRELAPPYRSRLRACTGSSPPRPLVPSKKLTCSDLPQTPLIGGATNAAQAASGLSSTAYPRSTKRLTKRVFCRSVERRLK
jgi:hypothetical protein